MVVMSRPAACEMLVMHDRVSAPFMCTLHAPQIPAPQPYLVPVSSRESRRTQSRGVSAATSTVFETPFTRSENEGMEGNQHPSPTGKKKENRRNRSPHPILTF